MTEIKNVKKSTRREAKRPSGDKRMRDDGIDPTTTLEIRKMLPAFTVIVSLVCSGVSALAEKLPPIFSGEWMGYEDKRPKQTCADSEVMTVTPTDVNWNTEGDCKIYSVHQNLSPEEFHIAVNLICFQREGRTVPLKVRKTEYWSVFTIHGETFLTETDPKDNRTVLYKKCG